MLSARDEPVFFIFARVTPLFNSFQQSARICTEQKFSAREQHVLSFSHWAHHCLAIFNKVHRFRKIRVFSPRAEHFVIFGLGAPLFSDFQQSSLVSANQSFQSQSRTFCYFWTGGTTFLQFSANYTGLYKTANSARDQHVLSFPHSANHFLAIFRKMQEFVQNSLFSPRSACFLILGNGRTTF